jgi:diguanylate cyclase
MMTATRLLLIDDDPLGRKRFESDLAQTGHHVDFVSRSSIEEGLTALKHENRIDCVLIDSSRTHGADLDFIGRARSLKFSPPILVLTGKYGVQGLEALRAGAEDYLVKSDLQPGEIFRAVQHAIVRHRIRREMEDREAQLRTLSFCDPLTGVLNRRGLDNACADLNARQRLSALLLDCDNFRAVNSRFGHAVGDRTLVAVSSRLRTGLRDVDHLARVGGDEFIVLLPNTAIEDATRIAERIQAQFKRGDGSTPSVTLSIGVSEIPVEQRNTTGILECTQLALARSKILGKDRVTAHSGNRPTSYHSMADRERDVTRLLEALPPSLEQAIDVLGEAMHRISKQDRRSAS